MEQPNLWSILALISLVIFIIISFQNINIKLTSWFLLPDINQSVHVKNLDATHLVFPHSRPLHWFISGNKSLVFCLLFLYQKYYQYIKHSNKVSIFQNDKGILTNQSAPLQKFPFTCTVLRYTILRIRYFVYFLINIYMFAISEIWVWLLLCL